MKLEINTNLQREVVNINGKDYQIKNIGEFDMRNHNKIERIAEQIATLKGAEHNKIVMKGIAFIVDKILIAPFFVKRKLRKSWKNQLALVNFFLETAAKNRESAESIPGYKDSTGEA